MIYGDRSYVQQVDSQMYTPVWPASQSCVDYFCHSRKFLFAASLNIIH